MEQTRAAWAALFDLDGVLVDTETQYTQFWTAVGQRYFPDDPDFSLRLKGETLRRILDTYFPGDPARQHDVTQALLDFESRMRYPFLPGAMELVAALHADGVAVAVVTSSDRAKMDRLYRAHPDFRAQFDRVFTSEDFPRSKPAPDPYLTAARHFGLSPLRCIVFEDSLNGIRSGQAAGMPVVGYSTTLPATTIAPLCTLVVPGPRALTVTRLAALVGS